MITVRDICESDIPALWEFLNALDSETKFMMLEPGERAERTDIVKFRDGIRDSVINGSNFLQVAVEDGKIVGNIHAERGRFRRNRHTAYIVVGILKEHCRKGLGTAFFRNLEEWAVEEGIRRLELTVECPNVAARQLYEKCGFKTEGTREKSMLVDGKYVDEYYMAKIL